MTINSQPNTINVLREQGILQDGSRTTILTGGISKTQTPSSSNSYDDTGLEFSRKRILDAMRNINWSRSYLWEVELDDVPPPFNKEGGFGFPAIEVDDTLALGSTFDFEAGINLLRVPQKKYSYDLKLTFYDDEDGTLEKFFEKWFNEIYDNDRGVIPVEAAVKMLLVRKLNSRRKIILTRKYLVYPNGTILGVNRTDSGPRQFMIDFVIAGYLNPLTFDSNSYTSTSTSNNTYQSSTSQQGYEYIRF